MKPAKRSESLSQLEHIRADEHFRPLNYSIQKTTLFTVIYPAELPPAVTTPKAWFATLFALIAFRVFFSLGFSNES
jgi:hypothetical protein